MTQRHFIKLVVSVQAGKGQSGPKFSCVSRKLSANPGLTWWHMSLILAFGRPREMDLYEFETSQGYILRPCVKKTKGGKRFINICTFLYIHISYIFSYYVFIYIFGICSGMMKGHRNQIEWDINDQISDNLNDKITINKFMIIERINKSVCISICLHYKWDKRCFYWI